MSDLTKVACIDFGATKVLIQVLGYDRDNQYGRHQSCIELTNQVRFDTTKNPNDPDEDYHNLHNALNMLRDTCNGFDGISVGIAAPVDQEGTLGKSGNLQWHGRNLVHMLEQDYGVPAVVDNDGAMLAAVEIVFGVLKREKNAVEGRSGIIVAPGTGIAVCLFIHRGGEINTFPGEGAHMVIDVSAKQPESGKLCGCGHYCVESMASGVAYARSGIDPTKLNDAEVVADLKTPISTLIANYTRFLPSLVQVVVMSGGIAHKRPSLVPAINTEVIKQLNGYVPAPETILSEYETGGVLGALARWLLSSNR